MISSQLVVLALAPLAVQAGFSPRATYLASASSYAGSTVSAVWPPPGATNTALDAYFPDANQVGNTGPTPTGDEAEAIATAPAAKFDSVYPLTDPSASDSDSSSEFEVVKHWGSLSPWYSVQSKDLPESSPEIPQGCSITQVHLLHRHGARYPTEGSALASLAEKVHNASTGAGFSASGPLAFLNTWTYKLGAELLTPFGREQLYDLGVAFRIRYGHLLEGFDQLPVFRTTSEARMVDSALNFAAGFFGVQSYQTDYHQLIMEEPVDNIAYNNTLAPFYSCPNFGGNGRSLGEWEEKYLQPALERISSMIQGINFTISDMAAMQQTCIYEMVALGFSEFCGLFTEEEWRGFDYLLDVEFWYYFGPGNPASAAAGLGWVAELVARLTETPITSPVGEVNTTLANNTTFPLNQPIYVDATHDTVISTILTTMNFTSLAKSGPLPFDHIPANLSYVASQFSPFASNLVGQVLSCPSSGTPSHIRWVLNDAVLPLTGLGSCPEDPNGLCPLDVFVKGMKDRINEIDYEYDCFANLTVPDPDTIVDGRYPAYLRNGTA
ncbi:phosphoglycerate mutase-like protein [Heliocybe sulcata]|uniref:Phosphoglycerate mutase-like protein n=1 Tax=Heliocybe sulcata TaxID=5364 RepID=A0A5C3N2F8_9AGAM|nr:phosphoglycerate mutase-like protein [Heliocybe sulcata]